MANYDDLAQALASKGAAFGVFPQMGGRRRFQDPQASADVPFQALRGSFAGLLGMLPDVANFMGRSPMPTEALGEFDYGPRQQLPYGTEFYLKELPLAPTSPVGQLAGQIGSFVPLSPMPAVRAGKGIARMAGQEITDVMSGFPPRSLLGQLTPKPLMLDVYHGTPHKLSATETNPLGEFDASKIGTGAGAQARGYGIYSSESPQFADYFAVKKAIPDLENIALQNGIQLSKDARIELMRQATRDSAGKPAKGDNYIDPIGAVKKLQNASIEARQFSAEKLQNTIREFQEQNKAFLYKADLPDEMIPKMLNLDLPIKEQPTALNAIRKMIDDPDILKTFDHNVSKGITGENAAINYVKGKTPVERSENLRKAGIPGSVYQELDTRNFVVFPGEEKNMKILERQNR